jgi:hypothetical protein
MAELAAKRGITVLNGTEKQVERGKVLLHKDTVAVGSVPFVKYALRQLGKTLPEHVPYPTVLKAMLHRKVKRLPTLREAKSLLSKGQRFFIKPADGWKRFTGFVAEFNDDYRFNGVSGSMPVWISEPVNFVSEWRVYVVDGKVLDIRFVDHGGNRNVEPDHATIQNAVAILSASGAPPAGYVIDFGVLDSGETALIEMNDGFSFGAYDGVSAETYWAVTVSRWQQLVE